jgi:hypothetical protein
VASDIGCRLFLGVATIWLASELARPRTLVQTVVRLRLALISYWLLFVIVSLVLVLWLTGLKALAVWLILPLFLVLVAVGERDSEFGSGFGKSPDSN